MQGAIEARKRDLGAAQQKLMPEQQQAVVKAKQAQLAEAEKLTNQRELDFNRASAGARPLEDREAAFQRADSERQAMNDSQELGKAEATVAKLQRDLNMAQDEFRKAVIPREPVVTVIDKADSRGLYMSGALGGVALLFGIVMVAGGSGRDEGDFEEMGEQAQ